MSKSIIKKIHEKPGVLDQKPPVLGALERSNSGLMLNNERTVEPLSPQYTDLLSAPKSNFEFKTHFLPVAAILFFSLVLVLFYQLNSNKSGPGTGRGVAGNLNDLSNGRYEKQAADYSEEKTCIDHTDGTKTCTTKTKLRREFR